VRNALNSLSITSFGNLTYFTGVFRSSNIDLKTKWAPGKVDRWKRWNVRLAVLEFWWFVIAQRKRAEESIRQQTGDLSPWHCQRVTWVSVGSANLPQQWNWLNTYKHHSSDAEHTGSTPAWALLINNLRQVVHSLVSLSTCLYRQVV